MVMGNKKILIIILNWNGWADTKECLDSLQKTTGVDFTVAVIDNGSKDDCDCIEQYALAQFDNFTIYNIDDIKQELQLPLPRPNSLILIKNGENLGFAKANNIGVKYAEKTGFEYIYLLNNDTVVEPDSLSKLAEVLYNSNYSAVVPQIRYYNPADVVWCCGGELNGFHENYHYKNENIKLVPDKMLIEISFATGCALLFKKCDINLLSEKFFFGEEDFELALRLKKEGKVMACVLDAVIYHKESSSINRSAKYLNKIYIHKLNRMINIKNYAPLRWPFITVYRSMKFFLLVLLVEKRGFYNALRLSTRIFLQAFLLKEVNKETFFAILNSDLT
jgi:GT2 family glycosyltransferase